MGFQNVDLRKLFTLTGLFYAIIGVIIESLTAFAAAIEIILHGQTGNIDGMVVILTNFIKNMVLPNFFQLFIRIVLAFSIALYLELRSNK